MKNIISRIYQRLTDFLNHRGMSYSKIEVTKERLSIYTDYMGTYVFHASDVISIKPYDRNGKLGAGLEITHKVEAYGGLLRFRLRPNDAPLKRIQQKNFLRSRNKTKPKDCPTIRIHQSPNLVGLVFRPQFFVALLALLLIIPSILIYSMTRVKAIIWIIFLFFFLPHLTMLAMWLVPPIKRFSIKEERHELEAVKFFSLSTIIDGIFYR